MWSCVSSGIFKLTSIIPSFSVSVDREWSGNKNQIVDGRKQRLSGNAQRLVRRLFGLLLEAAAWGAEHSAPLVLQRRKRKKRESEKKEWIKSPKRSAWIVFLILGRGRGGGVVSSAGRASAHCLDAFFHLRLQKRKPYKKKQNLPASTAGEAIEKMLVEKKISSKINYEVLRGLETSEAPKPAEFASVPAAAAAVPETKTEHEFLIPRVPTRRGGRKRYCGPSPLLRDSRLVTASPCFV